MITFFSISPSLDPRIDYNGWDDHIEHVETALGSLSLTMLCLLLFYQVVLIFGLGFKEYFSDYNGPLDFVIISLSIIADLTIPEDGSIAFIAIALFWRCVRVFHGTFINFCDVCILGTMPLFLLCIFSLSRSIL